MRILGIGTGHDASYCILENGYPIIHNEWERFSRIKEEDTDVVMFFRKTRPEWEYRTLQYITHWPHPKGWETVFSDGKLDNFIEMKNIAMQNKGAYGIFGHHQAHAANAFFSSNCDEALIVTIDAGGWDYEREAYRGDLVEKCWGLHNSCKIRDTATTIWEGKDNQISPLEIRPIEDFSMGGVWHDIVGGVFELSVGPPLGNQAGTVMAMAAMGTVEGNKYRELINFGKEKHSDGHWHRATPTEDIYNMAHHDPQELYEVAAALQANTEEAIRKLLEPYLSTGKYKNLCMGGGVALNCVAMGKILDWFPQLETVYIPPVPYDGGLSIGTAQLLYHQVAGNPRIKWEPHFTPYLGRTYSQSEVLSALAQYQSRIEVTQADDAMVADLLGEQKIISVFGGGSESGRRALGHRSILADPRDAKIKDLINAKVKHRQAFRPFAPSILREEVKNWFVHDIDSPYMNFAIEYLPHAREKVPAVVHFNNTGRLQTVTAQGNPWYYNFIKTWYKKSGVPIVLNTSFNDREPIVETPRHAINCFLKTQIDYLYFTDYNILVNKKG